MLAPSLWLLLSVGAPAPVVLPFEGFLSGADDVPVVGSVDLELHIYDSASGGTPLPCSPRQW